MPAGDRLKNWADKTASDWSDRLKEFGGQLITKGTEKVVERFEPEGVEASESLLKTIRDDPNTPDETKAILDKMLRPTKLWGLVAAIVLVPLILIPMITAVFQPLGNLLRYAQEHLFHSYRVDPIAIITAWRRDPEKYAPLLKDLEDQGFDEFRTEALKFYTQFYPSPSDLVRWQAREVFEPNMISKYGLDDELGGIQREPFYKAGMSDEQIVNFWRAHWEHASWMQVVEMLHRGLITEEDVYEWFRVVEVTPYWRNLLIQTAYVWPTRVDVRRWWEMGTIDESRLRELYAGMGYHGDNLDDYVLWTKIYVAYPDLLARWQKGWITLEDLRAELIRLGMSDDKATEMIQTKVKADEPARTEEGRNLTKTEIYKGVKKGVISSAEGIELLMDLNYTRDEAEYLLTINVESLEGSPETFQEFKDITTKYKRATGREETPMPDEVKRAADEVVRVTKEIEALQASIKDEEAKVIQHEGTPEEVTEHLTELRVSLHRAESELTRVKSEYDKRVAEWRHGSA